MPDEKGALDEFLDGLSNGYAEQDRAVREDHDDLEQKVKKGLATGLAESALNPFTWIRMLFK